MIKNWPVTLSMGILLGACASSGTKTRTVDFNNRTNRSIASTAEKAMKNLIEDSLCNNEENKKFANSLLKNETLDCYEGRGNLEGLYIYRTDLRSVTVVFEPHHTRPAVLMGQGAPVGHEGSYRVAGEYFPFILMKGTADYDPESMEYSNFKLVGKVKL